MRYSIKKCFALCLCFMLVCALVACNSTPSMGESDIGDAPSGSSSVSEGIGGEFDYNYEGLHRGDLKMFSLTLFRNVCGDKAYYEWAETFNKPWLEQAPDKRPYDECTLITFIKDFNVAKEDFKKYLTFDGVCDFTDAEIDLMYTGTAAEQAAAFANPNAVVVGEAIYTPKWLVTHSAQELRAAGITTAMLAEKSAVWQETLTAAQVASLTQVKTALQAAEQAAAQ